MSKRMKEDARKSVAQNVEWQCWVCDSIFTFLYREEGSNGQEAVFEV